MKRRSLWAPLASFSSCAIALAFAWPGSVIAQPAPEDEPSPPTLGPPPARTSPPAATTPPPAPTTPPPAPTTPGRTSPPAATNPPPPAPTAPAETPPSVAPSLPDPGATPGPAPILEAGGPEPVQPTSQPTSQESDSFLPTLIGPIGLFRVSTADVGPVNHLRLALHGEYFRASNFLVEGADQRGDTNTRLAGSFSFGFTPHESIELFGAILTSSNRNVRASEEGRRDPELIKSFGDLVVGGKGVLPLARGFSAGAELGLRFLSSISDLSLSPDSTSFWIGAVASADLRPLAGAPLRFHVNANFYLDNSSNLYDFTGTTIFTREVAMFAYGISGSRLRFALGADAPLEQLTAPVPLQPFVEYHGEIITASADPAFASYPDPSNRDQHWLTLGLRARVYRGLTLAAGVDIGLRSVGYQYGPPVPPYNVIFGAAFPLDIDAFRRPVVVTRAAEAPVPTTGTVAGRVQSAAADGRPIADAVVAFAGLPRAKVATDPDGAFSSGPLPPGSTELTVSAPGFEAAKAMAVVAVGGSTKVDVALKPKVTAGNVRGRVLDPKGKGVVATLRFAGASTFEANADASGAFSAALPPGPYKVTVESQGLPSKEVPIDVVGGQDKQLDVTLRSANPDVTLTGRGIALRVPIRFRAGPTKLDATAKGELDGVAEVMLEHPEIRTLRIEAHWSVAQAKKGAAKPGSVKKLTEQQAQTIKEHLVGKGVPADRIEAVGMGSDSPLVPNLGPANQAKNRRIELIVVQ